MGNQIQPDDKYKDSDWEYKINNDNIAEISEKSVKDKNGLNNRYLEVKGLRKGKTEARFTYSTEEEGVNESKIYNVIVDADLNVKVTENAQEIIIYPAEKYQDYNYKLEYESSDNSVVAIWREYYGCDGKEGILWRIEPLKAGKTEVKLKYVNEKEDKVEETKTYIINVGSDLNAKVTEKKEEIVPVKNNDLVLNVEENDNTPSNQINPKISLKNNSEKELDITNVKLKYYYTSDGDQDEAFDCYYAGTTNGTYKNLTSNLEGKILKLADNEKIENADKCLEITFNGGTLEANQEMSMNVNLHKSDWTSYDRTNDYSFNDADKICGFLNDELVSGLNPQELEQEGTGEEEKLPVENSDNKEEDKPQVTDPEKPEEEKSGISDEDREAANNVTLDIITKGQLRSNGNADVEIKVSEVRKPIEGFTLQLQYDEDLYEYEKTVLGINNEKLFSVKNKDGKVCLFFAYDPQNPDTAINKDFTLANIHFRIKKRANYYDFENAIQLVDDRDKCFFCADDGSELNINYKFENNVYELCY